MSLAATFGGIDTDDLVGGMALADWIEEYGSTRITNSVGVELVLIRPGTFIMGSPATEKGRYDDELQHSVQISLPFYLGIYPVTQRQWQAVMGNNPSHFKGDDLPVEQVSWDDVQEFLKKLNELEKDSEWLYRLPTEAEWEYACRAGTTTPFYFGNTLSSAQANFNGNYPYGGADKGRYLGCTTKVGSYPRNGFGLYDMHGNVWEWCEDRYNPEASARVLRGGSWYYNGRFGRSAYRDWYEPDKRFNVFGFRLAASIKT